MSSQNRFASFGFNVAEGCGAPSGIGSMRVQVSNLLSTVQHSGNVVVVVEVVNVVVELVTVVLSLPKPP
jgi:hypothetical protein